MHPKNAHFKNHCCYLAPRIDLMSIHSHLVAMLLISLMPSAYADEIGVVGPTYEIAEPDLLEVIQSRLSRMEKSGELARKQGEYRDRVVGAVEKPKPVPGLKATTAKRTYFIDPTWTLDRDIRGADGALLFARGLKVNPLDHISLREKLVFFDGRDRRQVSFAKQMLRNQDQAVKPILVAGEPLNLMRDWKRQVFYDQGGTLVRRMGIRQVPAVVNQDGKRLRVDEVLPYLCGLQSALRTENRHFVGVVVFILIDEWKTARIHTYLSNLSHNSGRWLRAL